MLTSTVWIGSAFFLLLGYGAIGISVDVYPRNPIVRLEQNFTFMCRVGKPILSCRITAPGHTSLLSINENTTRNNNYWYAGDGVRAGQCGITIARIADKQNGQFKCLLGFINEQKEVEGITTVTVARAPASDPVLVVTPEADRSLRAYNEDTNIEAKCVVKDARPAANISWYIGDDQITDGLSRTETENSQSNLLTVRQNLIRRLSWKDNGKSLKCVATHTALDDKPRQTIKHISVRFAPRPPSTEMHRFGFVVGEEGNITVHINANPMPYFTWTVDNEGISEGHMDSTQRFQADRIREMDNSTWEAALRILRVTAEDEERKFVLRAWNGVGESQYTVTISNITEPQVAPRPPSTEMRRFGFVVGEEGNITIHIYANPKPYLNWTVDNEIIPEGHMDSTQRFQAHRIREMGNSKWETALRILRVTAEDEERKFVLRAWNGVGESQYTVTISNITEAQVAPRPPSTEMHRFGFIVGEEGNITVHIYANPKPYLNWTVDNEIIPEGHMDSTKRFQADRIREMGNSTWEAALRILRVTAEDEERKFVLRAWNGVGESQYTVTVSSITEAQDAVRGDSTIVYGFMHKYVCVSISLLLSTKFGTKLIMFN